MIAALTLVDAAPQPWDEAGWSCCGEPDCPFVSKCLDTERVDAAWLLVHPPRERGSHDPTPAGDA